MKQITAKLIPALLTVVVLGGVVMPTALATPTERSAIASAAVAKPHGQTTLTTLKKEIIALNKRIGALEHGRSQPTGQAGGPGRRVTRGVLPKSRDLDRRCRAAADRKRRRGHPADRERRCGPAADRERRHRQPPDRKWFGVLPGHRGRRGHSDQARPELVGTSALIDGTIGNADIANGAIDESKLGLHAVADGNLIDGAVGRLQLADGGVTGDKFSPVFPITDGQGDTINPGQTKAETVTCPQGNRILSGGSEWTGTNKDGASVISSGPAFNGNPSTQWAVEARVDTGGQANTVIVEALCIMG